MDGSSLCLPLSGMSDAFGLPLRRRLAIIEALSGLAREYGYEQVEIPLVERATSFAEEVVGRSPWPEWDKRGCLYLQVPDYSGTYESLVRTTDALLVPEGTISVTRWLGRLLSENVDLILPLKIFYQTPCFRNELVDSLDATKRRQFTQFGMEILGARGLPADMEALFLIVECLRVLGVPSGSIRVRAGDVSIFNRLVELSEISADDAIALKEALDALAECRAGKQPERRFRLAKVVTCLTAEVAEPWRAAWSGIADGVDADKIGALDSEIGARTDELGELANALGLVGITVAVDLSVVRSHEYYTGIAFEIDVLHGDGAFVEIGGGGRYDKLVGHFAPASRVPSVPATGFAFGVERLVPVLERLDLLQHIQRPSASISLEESAADVLLVPPPTPTGYLSAIEAAVVERADGRAVDIYMGVPDAWRSYAEARRIGRIRNLIPTEDIQ